MFADIRKLQDLFYPGDMELPKAANCGTDGRCLSSWAGGSYLDNWAKVGTNWDMKGGEHAENHIHFDTFADDAWVAGSQMPLGA
mmetsp:Transcript_26320/g.51295  ORF Transcript_26320/g.51295 Transcript_26320/m.51295 type:complete len:84 (+) Transcript_26320:33-284(+)|eukprot:CAMPEP_0173378622 /NCGR_PEP_ID=MMETSP1356-20130122/1770_1 /TAXON_ID=77927 ORGANISM="Hemiselmis virescens, Strain PCC157" /NCGR_SAMPLE_ID=MMETSP1356 /ASSEMBLY_ACC=CAM_ASM_000847 /LENGTH=83 /DNA_ID=CAMNT_0014331749 /DNA_START=33 /DNA_END=284 /DNA_ORIENTATION=+